LVSVTETSKNNSN